MEKGIKGKKKKKKGTVVKMMMMTPSTIQEEKSQPKLRTQGNTHPAAGGFVLKYLVRDRIASESLYIYTDTCTVPALIKMTLIT